MEANYESKGGAEAKRAYSKPILVEYGNVRELTRGTSTKSLDFHQTTRQNA